MFESCRVHHFLGTRKNGGQRWSLVLNQRHLKLVILPCSQAHRESKNSRLDGDLLHRVSLKARGGRWRKRPSSQT